MTGANFCVVNEKCLHNCINTKATQSDLLSINANHLDSRTWRHLASSNFHISTLASEDPVSSQHRNIYNCSKPVCRTGIITTMVEKEGNA